ncbi:MAG TPA: peptidoglycan editing factor PgeF [Candidatus Nanopelagicales bacterium]
MAFVDGSLGPRVRWAFADRTDGVSLPPYDAGNLADHVGDDLGHVLDNRAALAGRVGVDAAHVVTMAPVHGNDVGQVAGPSATPVPEVDALVTTVPGIALLVLAADCVPVLLGDSGRGVVAVVHAGWRGVLSDVVGQTLSSMADLGARLDRVRAVVGPAICGRCYAVPRARFDEVVAVAPEAASVAAGGLPGLDLRAAVVARLRSAGVTPQLHLGCTTETASLYSYRRDHVTGRHGGVVTLLPEAVRA